MKIFLFSGSGNGSGKSTAARRLTQDVWSLANAIRDELTYKYPAYNWYNKSSEYKNTTIIDEYGSGRMTMREVMVEFGQAPCKTNPTFWVDKLVSYLSNRHFIADGVGTIGVDDIRKICELETIRQAFPNKVTHIHLKTPLDVAVFEPEFENDRLEQVADYVMSWGNS